MTTITQTITPFSGDPPSTSDPTNFDSRASTTLAEMADMVPEINTWTGQANTVAGEVNSAAAAAALSATTAQEASDAVLSQGTTSAAWSSVTTYDIHVVVIGSDGAAYRSLAGTNLNHDPTTDDGTWWRPLNPDIWLMAAMIFGNGFYPGWDFQAQDPVGNYPPTDDIEPAAWVWSSGVERYRALLTWGTTGGEIYSIVTAECEHSVDSGSNYSPVSASNLLTITYSSNGATIGGAWSAPA